jgi:(p)ppGpp synthase/HD superfamily hydrolase
MYTFKIEQAIKAAALLHQDHLRKGSVPLPYITHLMAVMMIVRDYTSDEDTLIAALLHDTLEDTDYTLKELEEDFGQTVAELVKTLTEPERGGPNKVTWMGCKKTYATQLRKGPKEAILIAAADKAHNFRSIVDEYSNDHKLFLQDFGSNLDDRLEVYQDIANAINSRLQDGIVHEFNHTFKAYKQFIQDVQEKIN